MKILFIILLLIVLAVFIFQTWISLSRRYVMCPFCSYEIKRPETGNHICENCNKSFEIDNKGHVYPYPIKGIVTTVILMIMGLISIGFYTYEIFFKKLTPLQEKLEQIHYTKYPDWLFLVVGLILITISVLRVWIIFKRKNVELKKS